MSVKGNQILKNYAFVIYYANGIVLFTLLTWIGIAYMTTGRIYKTIHLKPKWILYEWYSDNRISAGAVGHIIITARNRHIHTE